MKILAISGSLRSDSLNSRVLRGAAEMLPAGVELELWDGLKEVPPYDEDDDVTPAPAAVARLRAAIAGADALLIATPEYNSSIPGQLKNALDWASRPFATNVAAQQAGRGHRRQHGHVRRGLGTGGAAQGARCDRRSRRGRRAADRAGAREVRSGRRTGGAGRRAAREVRGDTDALVAEARPRLAAAA